MSSTSTCFFFHQDNYKILLYCLQFFCFIDRLACSDINIELESFITTLYTCESAVYLDASPMRKQTLKKYLLSVVVPIGTTCKALGFNDSEKIQEDGPVEEVCQLILENIRLKIEFLRGRTKNTCVIDLLYRIIVKKINPKLKQYVSVSGYHCVLEDDF